HFHRRAALWEERRCFQPGWPVHLERDGACSNHVSLPARTQRLWQAARLSRRLSPRAVSHQLLSLGDLSRIALSGPLRSMHLLCAPTQVVAGGSMRRPGLSHAFAGSSAARAGRLGILASDQRPLCPSSHYKLVYARSKSTYLVRLACARPAAGNASIQKLA